MLIAGAVFEREATLWLSGSWVGFGFQPGSIGRLELCKVPHFDYGF